MPRTSNSAKEQPRGMQEDQAIQVRSLLRSLNIDCEASALDNELYEVRVFDRYTSIKSPAQAARYLRQA